MNDTQVAGVSLTLDLAPDVPLVSAQQIQIEQVILNLARNAIEALHEVDDRARRLTILTHYEGGRIQVRVRDNGPGLRPELSDTLFDPLVTSKPDGMGLGLSISHGIIEAHGGKLRVVAPKEGGAEFAFDLPLIQDA